MNERGCEIPLLTEDEAEQVVRAGMFLVQAKRLGQLFPGALQVAAAGGIHGTRVNIIGRSRR